VQTHHQRDLQLRPLGMSRRSDGGAPGSSQHAGTALSSVLCRRAAVTQPVRTHTEVGWCRLDGRDEAAAPAGLLRATVTSYSRAVTLGDFLGRVDRLEIRCRHCERYGRMRLAKLIEEHGADMPGPQLAVLLAKDCPKVSAPWGERCWVYFPQMTELFPPGG
jgi:hypothetical protein